ncbi:hypothetical protein TNCV_4726551 [Trichonephila clavipes]|nr:hypothetical protein TNCV_4726551 [Trichonephila clavipes]
MSTSTILGWTRGEGNILQNPTPVISAATVLKVFGPTDLTSTYSVCTRRVFGGTGIKPMPSGLESNAPTTRLPTAPKRGKNINEFQKPPLDGVVRCLLLPYTNATIVILCGRSNPRDMKMREANHSHSRFQVREVGKRDETRSLTNRKLSKTNRAKDL